MNVLFPFVGDTIGGSHISSWQLICALKKFSVHPVIIVHQDGHYLKWLEGQGGAYRLVELPYSISKEGPIANGWRILNGLWRARQLLKKLDIDLVHCNDSRMNMTWALWARAAGIPMIWHQRARWGSGRQTKISLKLASGVISISKFVADLAPPLSIPHEIIYNPVASAARDAKACAQKIRHTLGVDDGVRLVGCFGNARQMKRPDTVFQAALLLKEHYKDRVRILWCGDDRDGELSRLQETYGRPYPVLRLPFQTDVLSVMAGCDCVLASSEADAFGRSLIEAMSLGVPVVASNAGGHKEIIQDSQNGLLFPVDDAGECASAIMRVFNEQNLRENFIDEGVKTASRLAPDIHARQVVGFYRRLRGAVD